MKQDPQGFNSTFANMELSQYVFDKLNTLYPGKVTNGLVEGDVDDRILLFEIGHENKQSKENTRIGENAIIQITFHANTQQECIDLYDACVTNLIPDKVNVQNCSVTERLFTPFINDTYRIDIRVNIGK